MPARFSFASTGKPTLFGGWLCILAALWAALTAPAAEPNPEPTTPPRPESSALALTNEPVEPGSDLFIKRPTTQTKADAAKLEEQYQTLLKMARNYRRARQFKEASESYGALAESRASEALQRTALLELGQMAQEQNDLPRAQQIYSQWIDRWPRDPAVPEVTLRQGLVYRQMGLHARAEAKFYAVMTSALVLKPDRFEYYQQLVLRAQNEIAETQFDLGNYAEATEAFARLLRLECPPVNRSTIQHRYIQCLEAQGRRGDVIAQAEDFLKRYDEAAERPEVHFLCARALKQAGRNNEALQEVLTLLQEQHSATNSDPAVLAYWQRRAGNEIANQFYQEGDPAKALEVYLRLAGLDSTPDWQLPVWYQVGLVFERLNQPAKAIEYYDKIGGREKDVDEKAGASLKAVLEMAKWRKDFLGWQQHKEEVQVRLQSTLPTASQTNSPASSL